MKTLTITKQNARKAHEEAGKETKKVLENLFGKKVLLGNVMDRVKTFEDACAELGIDWGMACPKVQKNGSYGAVVSFAQALIVTEALNEGWQPDFNNGKWDKHYPYFEMRSSAGGFRFSGSVCGSDATHVGARLCFKSEELARYAGMQFESIYKGFMTF